MKLPKNIEACLVRAGFTPTTNELIEYCRKCSGNRKPVKYRLQCIPNIGHIKAKIIWEWMYAS
jgi:hypothetical protein